MANVPRCCGVGSAVGGPLRRARNATRAVAAGFAEALATVEHAIHVGHYVDETAAVSRWHLPLFRWLARLFSLPAAIAAGVMEHERR